MKLDIHFHNAPWRSSWQTRLRQAPLRVPIRAPIHSNHDSRRIHRLSRFWVPTGRIAVDAAGSDSESINALLTRAGFFRQSHSGLYHFLPLGLRVQEKVERLLDHFMQVLGASKVSLSTLSSEDLWRRSGRLQGDRSELFSLVDRKGAKYLLSPTHEEEITTLVASLINSYRDLPLKLYQITRKYRDEPRPRGGLLRSREFLMKDLYTFDVDEESALSTYSSVRQAYDTFFASLKLPVLPATASSGSIGGDMSHEYHLPSPLGEDTLLQCSLCGWKGNEEVAPSESLSNQSNQGRSCPSCNAHATVTATRTIELGHTFHLGTKYSVPLNAQVATSTDSSTRAPVQMGCHGIGVSRLIASTAAHLSDSRGLNWPVHIAPFQVVVIPGQGSRAGERAEDIGWKILSSKRKGTSNVDVVVDDRLGKDLVWKMKDADLVGFPILIILGKVWEKDGLVEVQCRRKDYKDFVLPERAGDIVNSLIDGL